MPHRPSEKQPCTLPNQAVKYNVIHKVVIADMWYKLQSLIKASFFAHLSCKQYTSYIVHIYILGFIRIQGRNSAIGCESFVFNKPFIIIIVIIITTYRIHLARTRDNYSVYAEKNPEVLRFSTSRPLDGKTNHQCVTIVNITRAPAVLTFNFYCYPEHFTTEMTNLNTGKDT